MRQRSHSFSNTKKLLSPALKDKRPHRWTDNVDSFRMDETLDMQHNVSRRSRSLSPGFRSISATSTKYQYHGGIVDSDGFFLPETSKSRPLHGQPPSYDVAASETRIQINPYGNRKVKSLNRSGPNVHHSKSIAPALLMFGEEPDNGSTLTGWSEQELLKRQAKKEEKRKEKGKYGKKKESKKRETRILNLPSSLSETQNAFSFSPKNRYSKGMDDAPASAATGEKRSVIRYGMLRRKVLQPAAPMGPVETRRRRSWRNSSRSSEDVSSTAESSQGSLSATDEENIHLCTTDSSGTRTSTLTFLVDQGSSGDDYSLNWANHVAACTNGDKGNSVNFDSEISALQKRRRFHVSDHENGQQRNKKVEWSPQGDWRPSRSNNMSVSGFKKQPAVSLSNEIYQNTTRSMRSIGLHKGAKGTSDYQRFKDGTTPSRKAVDAVAVDDVVETGSFSSFPLLSTDASGKQRQDGLFQAGGSKYEVSSSGSSSSESVSTASVRELLGGSFPSPSGTKKSAGINRREPSVRFAVDIEQEHSKTEDANHSPTSVAHLARSVDGAGTLGIRRALPKYQNFPPRSGSPSRNAPKSILRTRRIVSDCPSDEGSGVADDSLIVRRVKISVTPTILKDERDHIKRTQNDKRVQYSAGGIYEDTQPSPLAATVVERNRYKDCRKLPVRTESESIKDEPSKCHPPVEPMNVENRILPVKQSESMSFNPGFMENVAAVVMQTVVRRFLARLMVERRRVNVQGQNIDLNKMASFEDRAVQMYELAAIQIQSFFRGWWVRDSLQVEHFCATIIQRHVRGYVYRMRFQFTVYCTILVQATFRRSSSLNAAALRLAHVIAIQSTYRAFRTRKVLRVYAGAAAVIQKTWRSQQLKRKKLVRTVDSIVLLQSFTRRVLTRARFRSKLDHGAANQEQKLFDDFRSDGKRDFDQPHDSTVEVIHLTYTQQNFEASDFSVGDVPSGLELHNDGMESMDLRLHSLNKRNPELELEIDRQGNRFDPDLGNTEMEAEKGQVQRMEQDVVYDRGYTTNESDKDSVEERQCELDAMKAKGGTSFDCISDCEEEKYVLESNSNSAFVDESDYEREKPMVGREDTGSQEKSVNHETPHGLADVDYNGTTESRLCGGDTAKQLGSRLKSESRQVVFKRNIESGLMNHERIRDDEDAPPRSCEYHEGVAKFPTSKLTIQARKGSFDDIDADKEPEESPTLQGHGVTETRKQEVIHREGTRTNVLINVWKARESENKAKFGMHSKPWLPKK